MMKKLNFIMLVALSLLVAGCAVNNSSSTLSQVKFSDFRTGVQDYIDGIGNSSVVSTQGLTLSISQSEKYQPEVPKKFAAGMYQVVWQDQADKRVLVFQTEEKVGHITPIIPGQTDIGGYVEIKDPSKVDTGAGISGLTDGMEPQNKSNIFGLKLNPAELDYLIRILYKKFDNNMTEEEADNLNKVKDYALAIKFSNKKGIMEYHNALTK